MASHWFSLGEAARRFSGLILRSRRFSSMLVIIFRLSSHSKIYLKQWEKVRTLETQKAKFLLKCNAFPSLWVKRNQTHIATTPNYKKG